MEQIEEVINELFANDARELHRLCNKEMMKFGGISSMDFDDFYSRVGWDISLAKDRFDSSQNKTFKEYIHGVIKFSIRKEMKHRNRGKRQIIEEIEEIDVNGDIKKRKVYIKNVSIDAPTDEGINLCEKFASDFEIEKNVGDLSYISFEDNWDSYSPEMKEYLGEILSKLQRKILELMLNGYQKEQIIEKLDIDLVLYSDSIAAIMSNKNTRKIKKSLRRTR